MPLKEHFLKYRRTLTVGFICLLIVDFLQLLIPLIIKRAVDALTYETASSAVMLQYGAVILIIALIMACLRYVWRLFIIGHSRKVEESLRNRLFRHLENLSLSFYQRTRTGDIMARSINDITAVRMATGIGIVSLTDGVVIGISAVFFMIYINPFLTLISLIPAPFIVYFVKKLTRRMSSGYERVQKKFSDVTERVREAFAGIRVVKSFLREDWESGKVKDEGERYVSENVRLARTIALFLPMMTLFANFGLAVVIWLGGRLTILGRISTGDFVAFIGYLNLLTWPMMAMGWVTNLFQRGSASMRRLNYIFEETPEITGPVPSLHARPPKGLIEFKNLSLQYPEQAGFALKNISLTIQPGQTISIAGRVGSGKTTLLYTLPRLLYFEKDMLFLDGLDIHQFPLKILRENMGFVTQDTILFSDTIRNNVIFGRKNISEERLESVLKITRIYDDIQDLDRGLDTILGERGMTLSGGQRQRLTIARAIITDPPVLILDDALSMVDTRTEESILNQILFIRKDKTNLIVSHRFSTLSRADRIVVLDEGEITGSGDQESLLRYNMEFKRLYEKQIIAQELNMGD